MPPHAWDIHRREPLGPLGFGSLEEALGKGLEAELKVMGERKRWKEKRKLQGKKKQDQEREGEVRG